MQHIYDPNERWVKKLTRDQLQHCILNGLTSMDKLVEMRKFNRDLVNKGEVWACWDCARIAVRLEALLDAKEKEKKGS